MLTWLAESPLQISMMADTWRPMTGRFGESERTANLVCFEHLRYLAEEDWGDRLAKAFFPL
jgi:hypothetical protein